MNRYIYHTYTTAYIWYYIYRTYIWYILDLDKFANFAQDRVACAALVNHITHKAKLKWVQKDDERKGREAPWNHTPVTRGRADGVRVSRREAVAPRLLAFDEVEEAEDEE